MRESGQDQHAIISPFKLPGDKAFYESILENVNDGIWAARDDNIVFYANRALVRLSGMSMEKLIGCNVTSDLPAETLKHFTPYYSSAKQTRRSVYYDNVPYLSSNGERTLHSGWIVPVIGSSDKVDYYFCTVQDVTERRKLEEMLLQSQKMEAIGHLASGVAHDFNNLLSVINGYSEMILRSMSSDDPMRRRLMEVEKAAKRAEDLARQLLAFSRKQFFEMKIIDLNMVVKDCEKMLSRLIGEGVTIRLSLNEKLHTVRADINQLEQVLINLALNARDAMAGKGTLSLSTSNIHVSDPLSTDLTDLLITDYVIIEVKDTGCGMSKYVRSHLFEPFFTTKDIGKGTGLGLATAYGIIKQSGGAIKVETEEGQGTTFRIYLPAVGPDLPATAAEPDKTSSPGGKETILVVEDNADVRTYICVLIGSYGYNVLEAANAGEALLICEQHPGTIHLMFTDISMPHMNGLELAQRLESIRPKMKVIFTSGYADNISLDSKTFSPDNYIPKPLHPENVMRKIREFLDRY